MKFFKSSIFLLFLVQTIGCSQSPSVSAVSDESDATIGLSAQPSPEQDPGFLPDDFEPPTLVETGNFKLIPLGPALVEIDFAAYMSSIEHLQRTFSRSASWPHENISDEDAMQDMLNEQRRFRMRESFAYAVLTPEGDRELGCVYVYPSPRREYDAMVRLWVTKAEYDAGFDETLYAWVQDWLQSWPFENIAYPGRSISWEEWEKVPSV